MRDGWKGSGVDCRAQITIKGLLHFGLQTATLKK